MNNITKKIKSNLKTSINLNYKKPKQAKANSNLYLGHRGRLRKKLLDKGCEALADYELLEMLLAFAQPRKDTKPIAKNLLTIFKHLNNVCSADVIELQRVEGVGDTASSILKLVHAISVRILRDEVKKNPCLDNIDAVVNYARASIGYLDKEVNLIFFLDTKNFLIDTEMRFVGTIDQVFTYPREILKKALELKAKSFIMIHNHPSGSINPSTEDLELTRHIHNLASMMDIILHDHIIVSRNGYYSMKLNRDI